MYSIEFLGLIMETPLSAQKECEAALSGEDLMYSTTNISELLCVYHAHHAYHAGKTKLHSSGIMCK